MIIILVLISNVVKCDCTRTKKLSNKAALNHHENDGQFEVIEIFSLKKIEIIEKITK